jgi:hypothetical protein
MSPLDAAQVRAMISGYTQSAILFTAVELGVLDELARAGRVSATTIAEQLHLSPTGTERLLDALVAYGVIDKNDADQYALTAAAAALLTRDGEASMVPTILHQVRHIAPLLARLPDAVRTGAPQVASGWPFSRGHANAWAALSSAPAELEIAVAAQDQASAGEGEAIASVASLGDVETLVDFGGGGGQVAIELARACPKLRILLVDQPDVVAIAERRIAAAGLAERIFCIPGDIRSGVVLPDATECVLLSSVLSSFGPSDQRRILSAVREMTDAGSRLLVSERLLDDHRTGPEAAALASLESMLVHGGGGLTREDIDDLLRATGFGIEAVHPQQASKGRRDLVIARAVDRSG